MSTTVDGMTKKNAPIDRIRKENALHTLEQYTSRQVAINDQVARVAGYVAEKALAALDAGASYQDLAEALGITRQAAHKRYATQPTPAEEPDLFSEGNGS